MNDNATRTRLIRDHTWLVPTIARRYRGGELSFAGLIRQGNLGLVRASQDYAPEIHGVQFEGYAEIWIKAFVHRAICKATPLSPRDIRRRIAAAK